MRMLEVPLPMAAKISQSGFMELLKHAIHVPILTKQVR